MSRYNSCKTDIVYSASRCVKWGDNLSLEIMRNQVKQYASTTTKSSFQKIIQRTSTDKKQMKQDGFEFNKCVVVEKGQNNLKVSTGKFHINYVVTWYHSTFLCFLGGSSSLCCASVSAMPRFRSNESWRSKCRWQTIGRGFLLWTVEI